ncbi:DUF6114 domain-containing protein [Actinokineospora sp. HUAS TT18]|uniref:DUF6114 domain-containing protein n=1 Tax=Actinokineospora sp. HUAS TT18 TaxID=3447451 RepID=UPI003F51EAFA
MTEQPEIEAEAEVEAPAKPGRFARLWQAFTRFRRTRPFWGGAWLAFGGWVILSLTIAPLSVTFAAGVGGVSGYLLGGSMMMFAFFAWFVPSQRHLAGLLGVIFAVASLVLSNLGGFLVGMFCGVVGGAMIVAWGPPPEHKLLKRLLGRPTPVER